MASVNLGVLGMTEPYFAVGTVFIDDTEREPSRGRVILYAFKNTYFQQCCVMETRGSVYALASLQGKLLAAINTGVRIMNTSPRFEFLLCLFKIVLFGIELAEDSTMCLKRISEWNHNYLITSIVVRDEYVIAGDAVASLALLRITDGSLVTVARDYTPLWPLCFDVVDEKLILGANVRLLYRLLIMII